LTCPELRHLPSRSPISDSPISLSLFGSTEGVEKKEREMLQPTIRCALLSPGQPTIRCTLLVDITTDYPLCYLLLYSNRLSAMLSLALQCVLYTLCGHRNGLSTLLCLSILQPTIRSALFGDTPTDYPMCFTLSLVRVLLAY
jgi:hypothetical protein